MFFYREQMEQLYINLMQILKTGDEFEEIEKEFYRDGPTIYASAIHNDFIVQVYRNGVLLLDYG
jgi:hypothetical protein